MSREYPETSGYSRTAIVISALVGVVLAIGSVWLVLFVAGETAYFEELFRVAPTVEGGGVGTDWNVGNTMPALDFLIALVHAADVLLGVFILLMVFIHWAAFRRLADRMRQPGEPDRSETVAADGGTEPIRYEPIDDRTGGGTSPAAGSDGGDGR